jgi:hypothetical protein
VLEGVARLGLAPAPVAHTRNSGPMRGAAKAFAGARLGGLARVQGPHLYCATPQ